MRVAVVRSGNDARFPGLGVVEGYGDRRVAGGPVRMVDAVFSRSESRTRLVRLHLGDEQDGTVGGIQGFGLFPDGAGGCQGGHDRQV